MVNTHYHYDHTLGNVLYPGARIIAHETGPVLHRPGPSGPQPRTMCAGFIECRKASEVADSLIRR